MDFTRDRIGFGTCQSASAAAWKRPTDVVMRGDLFPNNLWSDTLWRAAIPTFPPHAGIPKPLDCDSPDHFRDPNKSNDGPLAPRARQRPRGEPSNSCADKGLSFRSGGPEHQHRQKKSKRPSPLASDDGLGSFSKYKGFRLDNVARPPRGSLCLPLHRFVAPFRLTWGPRVQPAHLARRLRAGWASERHWIQSGLWPWLRRWSVRAQARDSSRLAPARSRA